MAQPSQSALRQHEVHAEGACLFQYSRVGDLVLPGDAEDYILACLPFTVSYHPVPIAIIIISLC